MGKSRLIGTGAHQHLMRVRIRTSIFEKLEEVAVELTEETGEHVTVSDLVRCALYNWLLIHESTRQLEHAPPELFDDEEHLVVIDENPMLKTG